MALDAASIYTYQEPQFVPFGDIVASFAETARDGQIRLSSVSAFVSVQLVIVLLLTSVTFHC